MNRTVMLSLVLAAGCATASASPPMSPAHTAVELAARRAQVLEWLREYRLAGAYPTDASGRPLSVFVDAKGVRCPMAELIHKSGRDDLVEAVTKEGNAVRLADVHDGPLHDWMLASGLTQDEIDLVQGAANIDFGWMQNQEWTIQVAQGTAEVRGKLETAELALRQGTAHSLEVALGRLPPSRTPEELAHAKIAGKVLSAQAIAAQPKPSAGAIQLATEPRIGRLQLRRGAVYPTFRVEPAPAAPPAQAAGGM